MFCYVLKSDTQLIILTGKTHFLALFNERVSSVIFQQFYNFKNTEKSIVLGFTTPDDAIVSAIKDLMGLSSLMLI